MYEFVFEPAGYSISNIHFICPENYEMGFRVYGYKQKHPLLEVISPNNVVRPEAKTVL